MSAPEIFTRRKDLTHFLAGAKLQQKTIGFVPTMGALHAGHASLIEQSARENQITILSIFVNPKQFGPNEDFSKYPRTFTDDVRVAGAAGATCVFAPTAQEMYPEGFSTHVSVPKLSDRLCGAARPGHFDGVSTVVLLLLNLAQANQAYFGMKDFQQLTLIQRLCHDLGHPTRIVGVPTVREADGLAMSSRNRYLDEDARSLARTIPEALAASAKAFLEGERAAATLVGTARSILQNRGLEPQYLELLVASSLEPAPVTLTEPAVLAVAQPIATGTSSVRLIDNVLLSPDTQTHSFLDDLTIRATAGRTHV